MRDHTRGSRSASAGRRGTDLIAIGRQMIKQYLASVRTAPAVQITFLARLPAQPAPEYSKPDAELAGQLGPDSPDARTRRASRAHHCDHRTGRRPPVRRADFESAILAEGMNSSARTYQGPT